MVDCLKWVKLTCQKQNVQFSATGAKTRAATYNQLIVDYVVD